jgi:hypothetical protein
MLGDPKDPLGLINRYTQLGGFAIAVVGVGTNIIPLIWVGLTILIVSGAWSIMRSVLMATTIHKKRHAAKKRSHS